VGSLWSEAQAWVWVVGLLERISMIEQDQHQPSRRAANRSRWRSANRCDGSTWGTCVFKRSMNHGAVVDFGWSGARSTRLGGDCGFGYVVSHSVAVADLASPAIAGGV
jgi:hypothetical protein